MIPIEGDAPVNKMTRKVSPKSAAKFCTLRVSTAERLSTYTLAPAELSATASCLQDHRLQVPHAVLMAPLLVLWRVSLYATQKAVHHDTRWAWSTTSPFLEVPGKRLDFAVSFLATGRDPTYRRGSHFLGVFCSPRAPEPHQFPVPPGCACDCPADAGQLVRLGMSALAACVPSALIPRSTPPNCAQN